MTRLLRITSPRVLRARLLTSLQAPLLQSWLLHSISPVQNQPVRSIVFSTLNTTRARLDLVRRLGMVKIRDPAAAQVLKRLIKRFEAGTRLRNEFNHCMYRLNAQGEITHTHLMRPHEEGGRLTLGDLREMDERRVQEIVEANRQLKQLNRDLWDFLPQLRASLAAVS